MQAILTGIAVTTLNSSGSSIRLRAVSHAMSCSVTTETGTGFLIGVATVVAKIHRFSGHRLWSSCEVGRYRVQRRGVETRRGRRRSGESRGRGISRDDRATIAEEVAVTGI